MRVLHCLQVWSPVLIDGLSDIADIRGGEQHTLALSRTGRVLSFGAATYGMLGRADLDATKACVKRVVCDACRV